MARNNIMNSLPFCVWLVPSQPYKDLLHSLIAQLAADYQSVEFEPHLTLFSGTTNQSKQMINHLQTLIKNQQSLETTTKGIDVTTEYYKSVFISLVKHKTLEEFYRQIKQLDRSSHYQFIPHLSLLYQNSSLEKKRKIAKNIKLPFKKIAFNQIVVISAPDEKNAGAVKHWKYLYRKNLS